MLYKLVLGPAPTLHTNVHENYENYLIHFNEENLIGS